MFEIAYLTTKGRAENNEDRIYINGITFCNGFGAGKYESCLVAVCDGVGGSAFGEEAAEIACGTLSEFEGERFTEESVCEYVKRVNENLRTAQQADRDHSRMATVIAALYTDGEDICAFNAGDSEIRRMRHGILFRISELHKMSELMEELRIDAKGEELSHTVTKCLNGKAVVPYISQLHSSPEDVFLLYSDGIGDKVDDQEMLDIIQKEKTPAGVCKKICELALEHGSGDNISIITVRRC